MSHVTDAFAVLFRHAEASLKLEELDALAGLSAAAGEEAQNLSEVCEGLAGLVLADGDPDGTRAGNFQESDSVARLLCHLAHSLDVISGMIDAGDAAKYRAQVLRGKKVAE